MSRINYRIFLASVLSFVFLFSFFQTSQAGFFDWFSWFKKRDSQSAAEVVSRVQQDAFYTVSISKSGSGVITSDDGKINCGEQCKASFPANSKIVLKAEAGDNYKFDRWNGCDKISGGECQTTLNKSKMIVVKFSSKKASSSSSSQKSSSLSASKTNSSKSPNTSSKSSNQSSLKEEISFSKTGNLMKNNPGLEKDTWHLLYEEPGKPALYVKLKFNDINTNCKPEEDTISCEGFSLKIGDRVKIKGKISNNVVNVEQIQNNNTAALNKSSSSSFSENFITFPRASIPWTIGILVLDGIDQNSKAVEPLKEAIDFVESLSKFDITYSLALSSLPHTYTKYDCGEGLQTCVVVNYWDIDGAIMDSLPIADSYIIFWNTNNQPPLQAGSTWGVDSWGILKGGIRRPYATIPADMWWYNNNQFEGFQRRSAQIISHELINIINAKLEAAPYYCASLTSAWADISYINESERLKKLTDDCYNKY